MELGLIILFIAVGLVFLLVEILVTPGLVLGIIGIAFMTFGIVRSYYVYGTQTGNIVLVSVFVGTIIIVFLALKGGVWKRMASKDVIDAKAIDNVEDIVQVGDQGKTISALRPSGNALFGDKRLEVTTLGESITSGSNVEVFKIARNKVYVRIIESQSENS